VTTGSPDGARGGGGRREPRFVASRSVPAARGGPARPIGDSVSGALRALGMPTRAASRRVRSAWETAADPAWRGLATPARLLGGTLVVAVTSASLREELVQFHAARLLDVIKKLLPEEPIVAIRFEAGGPRGEGTT
jgi:hypothetical protein